MLTIEVAAINGAPPPAPMAARFDEAGGSIGRDPGCTLVLPDAEKRISRRHALINCRAGRFSLRNQGSAIAVLLNGAPVDYGAEAPLAGGDRIDIGDFSLRVHDESLGAATIPPAARAAAAARQPDILADFGGPGSAVDPFADLIPPPAPPPERPMRRPAPAQPTGAAGSSVDPFADLIPPPAPPVRPTPQPAPMQHRGVPPPAAIPEDFDPFAEPFAPPPPQPSTSAVARDDFSDLLPPRKERVDELFGLHGGEPFPPGHPLAAPSASATPGPVGIDDLLRPSAPAAPPPAAAPVQRDDAPELSARMRLPETAYERPVETPVPPPMAPPAAASDEGPSTTGGMMLSWDERGRDGVFDGMKTMVIRGGMPDRRQGDRRRHEAPLEMPAAPSAPPAAAADQKLLQALLEGLGLEKWPDGHAVDAEAMRRLGRLLRAAVQGTIDLLRARATIKSEVQANMTMIVSRDNNPLKFSPNAEAALVHLLGPTQRGFMSATAAMDDAYRDLVAHQFGFTAGTRAALADVLRRFDPAVLEQRLAARSVLDALLPAHRKGKLWDLFTERFAQISAEAEDDFHRLFGKEFLRAYEEQVAKMSAPRGRRDD